MQRWEKCGMALACVVCMWSVEGLGRGGRKRENVSSVANFEAGK